LKRASSAALELRVTSQIQAMHLNANPEKWGVPFSRMQAFVAYATKVRHALGLNFAATSAPLTRALAHTLV